MKHGNPIEALRWAADELERARTAPDATESLLEVRDTLEQIVRAIDERFDPIAQVGRGRW